MKKIVFVVFVLLVSVMANGQQTNCTEKVSMNKCNDTIVNKVEYIALQNSFSGFQNNYDSMSKLNVALQTKLNNLKVEEFLNISDTTIFGSKFLSIDEASISARNRDFYMLLKNIHDLNCVLNQKSEGSYVEMLKQAKEISEKASHFIGNIANTNEQVFSWLSESQVEYYRLLVKQYNELIETLK